ncbi:MAG: HNH endonuclease signature motif containing protein [Chloroflexi bacterium]|nr:HNH endonuclease signature motif containing protein [Chloroflexota bacterium]
MNYQDRLAEGALAKYAAALNARAARAGLPGRLTAEGLRDRILESGGRCEWCDVDLVDAEFELDHVLSLKQGGANEARNLVLSCPDCNRRKGQKHPARFAAEIFRETGRETNLIARLFARYEIEAAQQLALFDFASGASTPSVDASAELTEVPPYNWTK